MRLKYKKIAVILIPLFLIAVTSGAMAGTVILHPGYVSGNVSINFETVTDGNIDAYSIDEITGEQFDAHTIIDDQGDYNLIVEGDHDYKVLCRATMTGEGYTSCLFMGRQDTYIPVGKPGIENFDFSVNPGYIAPIVTVTGGEIQEMKFLVVTDYSIEENVDFAAIHSIDGNPYLDGITPFPMKPWKSIDSDVDGVYETYVKISGMVRINDLVYTLEPQYIDVVQSDTTYVHWSLDVLSTSLSGSVIIEGETISYYYLNGAAEVEGIPVSFFRTINPGSNPYYVNVPPTVWSVYPSTWMLHQTGGYNWLRLPKKTISVPPNEHTTLDWYIIPGYVTGSVNLYGAYGNLKATEIYATNAGSAITKKAGNDYRFILHEGDWKIGYPYIFSYFSYDPNDPAVKSSLQITDNNIRDLTPPISITPGSSVSGVDFSYGTATITVNYMVEGGGFLSTPRLFASRIGGPPYKISSSADGQGSLEETTFGECTITVLEGTHKITAYATVDGSYTKFGEFTITVEPGDVIRQDVEAPSVYVEQPGGSEHIYGESVLVKGTATDDSEITSITVDGEDVDFISTGNTDDPNEVSFSTTVDNLVFGENVIEIVVTDGTTLVSNSITIERKVFRDDSPPEIISITGPVDPVALTGDYLMTGVFIDPDIDDTHTAIWDWGDDTTTAGNVDQINDIVTGYHEYTLPGVYTITLTVIDSNGDSDTATWSQYLVIYDPSSGFVTGGGWINSPLGSYPADPELNGRANFGFVAKYKKGTMIPTGNTEFQFHAGDLNFHSDYYQWLVITGARAKFKGVGTINGEGSYNFILTAIDGDLISGDGVDKFRLKIWTEDETTGEETIIYDNMLGSEDDTTEIGGGSIQIHK
jgi:hypothetical protein